MPATPPTKGVMNTKLEAVSTVHDVQLQPLYIPPNCSRAESRPPSSGYHVSPTRRAPASRTLLRPAPHWHTDHRLADPPMTSSSRSMPPSELSYVDSLLLGRRPIRSGDTGSASSSSSSSTSTSTSLRSALVMPDDDPASSSSSSAGVGCGFGSSSIECARGRGWSSGLSGIYIT